MTSGWNFTSSRSTNVRVTLRKDDQGKFTRVANRELLAIKANPYWFGHDIYSPRNPEDGGPFTIGRVIHTSRSVGFTGYIGGVAVFSRALSGKQMEGLGAVWANSADLAGKVMGPGPGTRPLSGSCVLRRAGPSRRQRRPEQLETV